MPEPVAEPFPIYRVADRFLLYDANVVSHVRATHHMCGCLVGTLPQIPQQNVFLGLPMQLMTEEAALLIERGAAYVVDDADAHKLGLAAMREADRKRYLEEREDDAVKEAIAYRTAKFRRKEAVRKRLGLDTVGEGENAVEEEEPENAGNEETERQEEVQGLFAHTLIPLRNSTADPEPEPEPVLKKKTPTPPASSASVSRRPSTASLLQDGFRFHHTPTVSSSIYHAPSSAPSSAASISSALLPRPKSSAYALYKYLHSRDYFLSPGLRFGCQFMAYPGDPLRFHSHFVCQGFEWDEEIDMIDIVTGGRLGTGVKKAWVFGGRKGGREEDEGEARVFCVEWGGF